MTKFTKKVEINEATLKWFRDDLLVHMLKNASVLFSGNLVASLLGLAALSLTARTLGVEQFGVLVLIITYVLIVDRLVNFQSWQAVIKFGADALERENVNDFKHLIKFGFLLDGATAVLGAIISAIVIWHVGQWKGWNEQYIQMALFYSFTILFHISGTSTAILRLFGNFNLVALQLVIAAAIKLTLVALATITDSGLWGFLFAWAIVDILSNLILILFSYQELCARKLNGIPNFSTEAISSRFMGIWGFVWTTNMHSSVKLGLREIDIILISALLGPSGAGLYKIVKAIGQIAGSLTDPLYQIIYPNLARAVIGNDFITLKQLIFKPMIFISILSGLAILLFFVIGEELIFFILGSDYIDAFYPASIYLVGTMLSMTTFSFHPTLLSFGKVKLSFLILIISTVIYLLFLFWLTSKYGLLGASSSYVLFYMIWSVMQFIAIRHLLAKTAT